MIESFRLGIVPFDCVQHFTFCREEQTHQVNAWLRDAFGTTYCVVGEYGSGKTHFLNFLRDVLVHGGYAVAYACTNPSETPFHRPKRVFAEFARNLRYLSPKTHALSGFREFLREARAAGGLSDHVYFRHISSDSEESLWDWIECCERYGGAGGVAVPTLYDYSTAANVYTYLLSGLGHAASEILGLKGLVLLFDEAEWMGKAASREQLMKGRNFVEAVIRVASGDYRLSAPPSSNESGLTYARHSRRVPFLYKTPPHLQLVFAFTDRAVFRELDAFGKAQEIPLAHLSNSQLRMVLAHLCGIYDEAYPGFSTANLGRPEPRFFKVLEDAVPGSTRKIIKGLIEYLDLRRWAAQQ
ncbi:MAG: DUF2791 family P-loop domain-containing protein [Candidatus Sumerlaeota bacterium]|nr:DUF2791 family P-loop domain-containing protein [Candidatus Sumerlaeota bacterium]